MILGRMRVLTLNTNKKISVTEVPNIDLSVIVRVYCILFPDIRRITEIKEHTGIFS